MSTLLQVAVIAIPFFLLGLGIAFAIARHNPRLFR
jgi:hypothetical protein